MTLQDQYDYQRDCADPGKLGNVECVCESTGWVWVDLPESLCLPRGWQPVGRCVVCNRYDRDESAARAYLEQEGYEMFRFDAPRDVWGVRYESFEGESRDQGPER